MNSGQPSQSSFPEGTALRDQIQRRRRSGSFWRVLFQISTLIGIIALMALVYNIIISAFGLVAVQSQIEPDSLVLEVTEALLVSRSNTTSSEDDDLLAASIAADDNAIGFFGYAFYQNNADRLRLLAVDGVVPNEATVEDGTYPLARPLFIYTTADLLADRPEVAAFVSYYLNHVNEEIEDVGYFPVSGPTLAAARDTVAAVTGADVSQTPAHSVAGDLTIAGSSTVFPLSDRLAANFVADGYAGAITVESIGSTAGFNRFCVDGGVDIANASRPMNPAERAACQENGRTPIEIRVGTDAIALVVNKANAFADGLNMADLQNIFGTAQSWAEVNAGWPTTSIQRFIPGTNSGTLDFFAEMVFPRELSQLSRDELVLILVDNISAGLGRRFERDQRFYDSKLVFDNPEVYNAACAGTSLAEDAGSPTACTLPARSVEEIYELVLTEVVVPEVVATWSLTESIFRRQAIRLEAAQTFPDAELTWRSWITPEFLVTPQSSVPEDAGVRTAILGSLWVILITMVFSFPIGVGAAIYLEEYAAENRLNNIIQTNISNLAGVPSIIYGMLGLAIFVRALEAFTSGSALGAVDSGATANGRTILSAGMTLGLLILPLIIINSQEAIRAVPNSLRQAGLALGATKWQTIWHHVLPSAVPGILTGAILAMSRAIGETAPLVVIGASTFITVDPSGPFAKFTTLPIQIYQWTSRPQAEFRNIAAAAIIVLLIMLLSLNASAVIFRSRAGRIK